MMIDRRLSYEEIRDRLREHRAGDNLDLLKESRQVHNFSLSTMISYFYLDEMLRHRHPPLLLQGGILLLTSKQGKYKTFCYREVSDSQKGLLEFLQHLGTIYSIDRIPFLQKEGKFQEMMYDLEEVFDPKSYPNSRKRSQKIVYPFKQIDRFKITHSEINDENYSKVEILHNEWVEKKMADPNTFRMMFPVKRYLRCCKLALTDPKNFKSYIFSMNDEVIAVRIVGIAEKDFIADLANFGRSWDMPVSEMMNYLDTFVLADLRSLGYKKISCGVPLNKRLKMFKAHYPYDLVTSWMYSKF